ncbi:MAG: LysE family transporter [Anaerolineales bacterium]|jgi:threonine/homoserine/homoserine lactone efflux protein|nr:LysE family transporter [Chloroflexota bacterium]MBK6646145.1 LysE family transporter [Anaerolineales bacterium]MCC6985792.1 LysE family transporter [Anaerolineales bacterium]
MLFLKAFIIGISIAAPVGPIGVLCIRRTLANGKTAGFVSGMGAASADMAYGAIAAFGLTAVTGLLVNNAFWLRIVGGLFLLYLGAKTFREKPSDKPAEASADGLWSMYLSTFFLTITNPMTILAFAAIFAGTMLGTTTGSPLVMVAGVFAGSAAWWLTLSIGVGILRNKLTPAHMAWINRISGSIIIAFGLFALLAGG